MNSWRWVAVVVIALGLGVGTESKAEPWVTGGLGSCDTGSYGNPNARGANVRGIALDCYRQPSGDTSVAVDFSKTPFEAYQLVSDAWQPAPIAYGRNGRFTLDVPEGRTYAIRLGSRWFVSTARSIDLSVFHTGRPDAEPFAAGESPAMSLSLSNLEPWTPYDQLVLSSDTTPDTLQIVPAWEVFDGSTTMSDPFPSYWSISGGNDALDAAKGDRAVLMQLHSITGDNVDPLSTACVRALDFSPLSLTAGQTTPLEGAMTAPAQKAFTVDLKLSQISALAPQVHPAAVPDYAFIDVVAVPGSLDEGWIGYLGELLSVQALDPTVDLSGTFFYVNPRASWSELAGPVAAFHVPMAVGATRPAMVYGAWQRLEPASSASGKAFTVTMTPPASFRIDGVDGHSNATLTSLTPLLTWAPPATGAANGYWIDVYRLYASGTRTVRRTVASIMTAQTQLRIPPGIFASGQNYAVVVNAANMGPPRDFRTKPFRDYSTAELTPAISGKLTAP